MTTRFEDTDQSILRWGRKCKLGHIGPNGYNVKYILGGQCLACSRNLPSGPYEKVFSGIAGKVRCTPEERRVAHIKQQQEWNARNKDKVLGYAKTYNNTEKRKQAVSERNAQKYKDLSPEDKKKRSEVTYQRYKARCASDPDLRAKRRESQKKRYEKMTDEQREEFMQKKKAYYILKQEKKKNDPNYTPPQPKAARVKNIKEYKDMTLEEREARNIYVYAQFKFRQERDPVYKEYCKQKRNDRYNAKTPEQIEAFEEKYKTRYKSPFKRQK